MFFLNSKKKVDVQKILIRFLINGFQSVLLTLLNAKGKFRYHFKKNQAFLLKQT